MKITKERMHFENDLRELKRSKKTLDFQQMSKIGYKQNVENKQENVSLNIALKKPINEVPTSPAFKSAQALGRAVSRAREHSVLLCLVHQKENMQCGRDCPTNMV